METQKLQYIIELLKTGDGASKAAQELEKLDHAQGKAAASSESLTAGTKRFYGAIAALIGAGFIKRCLNEFGEWERAVHLLNGSLVASGNFTEGYSVELQGLAKSVADVAKIEDEMVISGQATLIQFGAMRSEMPRLTQAMVDMAAAGMNVQTASSALGAAISGEFAPIQRLLKIDFPEGATRAEKLEMALSTLEGRFGGLAAAQSKMTGGLNEANLALKDAEKAIGEFIANGIDEYVRAVKDAAEKTYEWEDSLRNWIGGTKTSSDALREQNDVLADRLRHLMMVKRANGELTAEEAADYAIQIAGARQAADAYKALKEVRQKLLGFGKDAGADGEVMPAKRLIDPAAAMARLKAEQNQLEIITALNFRKAAGPGDDMESKRVKSAMELAKMEQARMSGALNQLKLDGTIDATTWNAEMDAVNTKYVTTTAAMAAKGYEIYQVTLGKQHTIRHQEVEAIETEYETRKVAIQEYFDWEIERAQGNADRVTAMENLKTKAVAAAERQKQTHITQTSESYQMMKEVGAQSAQFFASGMSNAMVSFISGTKSAKEAFREFAVSFLQQVAQMIMQMLILKAIKGVFGMAAEGGSFPAVAMAAGGVAGVDAVSGPTYFPRFNVLAGEAGPEVMTVMARPHNVVANGVNAVVGSVQGSQLAMLSAGDFRRMASGGVAGGNLAVGGQGGGGVAEVRIRLESGLKAEIIQSSIDGAVVQVVTDMGEDTPVSSAVRQLVK
jgi:hypothetical protein